MADILLKLNQAISDLMSWGNLKARHLGWSSESKGIWYKEDDGVPDSDGIPRFIPSTIGQGMGRQILQYDHGFTNGQVVRVTFPAGTPVWVLAQATDSPTTNATHMVVRVVSPDMFDIASVGAWTVGGAPKGNLYLSATAGTYSTTPPDPPAGKQLIGVGDGFSIHLSFSQPSSDVTATPFARTLLDDNNAAEARSTLGAVNVAGDTMTGLLNAEEGVRTVGVNSEVKIRPVDEGDSYQGPAPITVSIGQDLGTSLEMMIGMEQRHAPGPEGTQRWAFCVSPNGRFELRNGYNETWTGGDTIAFQIDDFMGHGNVMTLDWLAINELSGSYSGILYTDTYGLVQAVSASELLGGKANLVDGKVPLTELPSIAEQGGIPAAEKAVANGVATLDSFGWIPVAQFPNPIEFGAIPLTQRGAPNGVAPLNGSGLIDSAYLPSYVSAVDEVPTFSALPAVGLSEVIYVTQDTNLTYRWSGSAYVEISASLALGETGATAYRGDRGKIAYDHAGSAGNPHGTTFAQLVSIPASIDALDGLVPAADTLPYFTGGTTAALTTLTAFARTLLDDVDAAAMRTTLGAQAAGSYQPLDATLTAFAGVPSGGNQFAYFTGVDTMAMTILTSFARTLLDDNDATAMRTTLGAQALDATLTALAGLTTAANQIPYSTGVDTFAMTALTAFARTLLDDADAATMRATLGITAGTDELVKVDAADTTPGYLATKIAISGPGLSLEQNPASGNKALEIVRANTSVQTMPLALTNENITAGVDGSFTFCTMVIPDEDTTINGMRVFMSQVAAGNIKLLIFAMNAAGTGPGVAVYQTNTFAVPGAIGFASWQGGTPFALTKNTPYWFAVAGGSSSPVNGAGFAGKIVDNNGTQMNAIFPGKLHDGNAGVGFDMTNNGNYTTSRIWIQALAAP